MTNDRAIAEMEEFLAERADRLLRTAVLLTGSRETGQDLLQTAKSAASRGLRRLRELADGWQHTELHETNSG